MAMAEVPSISELSSETDEEEFLCDYEKQRLENIKENQHMLKMLGQCNVANSSYLLDFHLS